MKKTIINIDLIFLSILFLCGCKKSGYHYIEGAIWNTMYHITYNGNESLSDSIIPILNDVGNSLSIFEESSLVNCLNNSDSIKADAHLLVVYDKSVEINRLSNGKFDPTVSPLITAWGFGIGHKANTDTLAIDSIMQFIGINKTQKKNDVILKDDPRIQFNFSAIAKGYGCDEIGKMFRRNGVNDYMVEIGGEIVLKGKSPSNTDWKIAIDAPIEDDAPNHASSFIIYLTDVGIATSGNYRNFRKENGNTIAHTISPLTGKPYISEILSATVISKSCMESDALATACMASTPAEAMNMLKEYKAEGLLILSDSVIMTDGFNKFIISKASEPGRINQN